MSDETNLPVGVGVLLPVSGNPGRYLGLRHPSGGLEIPGGSVHPGEDPRFAAFREVVEETGLVVTALVEVYRGKHTNHRGHPYLNITYRGIPILPEEADQLRSGHGEPILSLSAEDLTSEKARFPELNRALFAALAKL